MKIGRPDREGPGHRSLGPASYFYSPECVEGQFSEVRIRHPA